VTIVEQVGHIDGATVAAAVAIGIGDRRGGRVHTAEDALTVVLVPGAVGGSATLVDT
jgi:hypothetical protein